ncbi:putative metalloprotease CJM1_0395 family protein [Hydrogenimonas thermophila]|uniref:SprA-related family protein n=1 Tax=Hydrogenimonas thermophila TaxID=223786 RepID=A0A1I5NKF2_9BACT|nr:putative metalloprotease CJM1_0395 family protein [Hydrogenimonas thermophila]WOE69252.1 putative metalloprotease CJM1_0395 family protein [Hydrogenimonas thermophila]WOE71762.1 putative metalloprotease CJM1_0395 family protein [Hydrogenimonas thermophila]SFP22264.1 SprA-related family protein [Hydrogenimonas thermophila]
MQVSSNWLTTYSNSNWRENNFLQSNTSISQNDNNTLVADNSSKTSNNSTENRDDNTKPKSINELDSEEKTLLAQLQASDSKVRAHESAHLSAAAGIAAGGASFTYERGPDGRMYAVAGEVPISISEGKDPQDTLEKMRQVEAAAMAPADPSPQDHAVAASARSGELKALMDLQKEKSEIQREEGLKQYSSTALQPIEQRNSLSITA